MWLYILVGAVALFILVKRLLTGKGKSISLKNKTIFITGCDSGFGFSLAVHCSGLGMKVVAGCYDDSSEGRHQLETMDNVVVVSLDVRDPASVEAAVEVVRGVCGDTGLHCLVNNAAVLVFGETLWQTEEQVRWQTDVNYWGPVRLSRAVMPLLTMTRDRARVVNMISNCTECPLPTLGPYTASKVNKMWHCPP